MQFVDTEVTKTGMSERAWCERHGISQSQMGKWRTGQTVPSLRSIEILAEALNQPAIGLAAIALGVDLKTAPAATPASAVPPEEAIERDGSLTESGKRIVLEVLAAVRDIGNGPGGPKRRRRSL